MNICEVKHCRREATETLETAQKKTCWFHWKLITTDPNVGYEYKVNRKDRVTMEFKTRHCLIGEKKEGEPTPFDRDIGIIRLLTLIDLKELCHEHNLDPGSLFIEWIAQSTDKNGKIGGYTQFVVSKFGDDLTDGSLTPLTEAFLDPTIVELGSEDMKTTYYYVIDESDLEVFEAEYYKDR